MSKDSLLNLREGGKAGKEGETKREKSEGGREKERQGGRREGGREREEVSKERKEEEERGVAVWPSLVAASCQELPSGGEEDGAVGATADTGHLVPLWEGDTLGGGETVARA